MRIRQTGRYLTFTAETDTESADLAAVAGDIAGQHFRVDTVNSDTLSMRIAGPGKAEVDRRESRKAHASEPINIAFDATPMPLRLISNLAATPFMLDGRRYASVEGFWQGLKFADPEARERVAALSEMAAKAVGPKSEPGDRFAYEGREWVVGTVDHWALMERANRAKFEQSETARAALLSTGDKPLEHKVIPDSRTIPGIIMADIWMRIRRDLSGR